MLIPGSHHTPKNNLGVTHPLIKTREFLLVCNVATVELKNQHATYKVVKVSEAGAEHLTKCWDFRVVRQRRRC